MKSELGSSTVLLFSKNRLGAMMTSFSALRNAGKFITPQYSHMDNVQMKDEASLRILDGFKMYAMFWMFVGGTYLFAMYFVISNPQDMAYFYSKFMFTLVPMSYLGIDAFLIISATLNTYHLIK